MLTRGVIFDLDGTLADTLDDLCASVNAIRPANCAAITREQARGLISFGARRMIRELLALTNEDEVEALLGAFRAHYAQNLTDQTRLFPGWPAALDQLAALRTPLAVLTNKPDGEARAIGARLLGRWPFTAIRGWVAGGPAKPDPSVALELAAALQREPGAVLFVGDSTVDIETAQRAGMTAIGVQWGFHSAQELLEAGAAQIIDSPIELVGLARRVTPTPRRA